MLAVAHAQLMPKVGMLGFWRITLEREHDHRFDEICEVSPRNSSEPTSGIDQSAMMR